MAGPPQHTIVVEEVWENQRRLAGAFRSDFLLPTERQPWSTKEGDPHPGTSSDMLPSGSEWRWVTNWEADVFEGTCKKGWIYSPTFFDLIDATNSKGACLAATPRPPPVQAVPPRARFTQQADVLLRRAAWVRSIRHRL